MLGYNAETTTYPPIKSHIGVMPSVAKWPVSGWFPSVAYCLHLHSQHALLTTESPPSIKQRSCCSAPNQLAGFGGKREGNHGRNLVLWMGYQVQYPFQSISLGSVNLQRPLLGCSVCVFVCTQLVSRVGIGTSVVGLDLVFCLFSAETKSWCRGIGLEYLTLKHTPPSIFVCLNTWQLFCCI